MTTIITRLGTAVSGNDVGLLPRYNVPLVVTSGLHRRYSAWSVSDALVDAQVRTIPDSSGNGGPALRQDVATNKQPYLRQVSGKRYLALSGDANSPYLYTDLVLPQPYTIMMIARVPAQVSNGYLCCQFGGATLGSLFENTGHGLSANAGSTATLTTATIAANEWFVAAAAFNGSSTIVALDDVQVTGNAGTNAQAYQIAIPRNTSARAIDLMEFVVWDRALNSDELTAEHSNLTASYGL